MCNFRLKEFIASAIKTINLAAVLHETPTTNLFNKLYKATTYTLGWLRFVEIGFEENVII